MGTRRRTPRTSWRREPKSDRTTQALFELRIKTVVTEGSCSTDILRAQGADVADDRLRPLSSIAFGESGVLKLRLSPRIKILSYPPASREFLLKLRSRIASPYKRTRFAGRQTPSA